MSNNEFFHFGHHDGGRNAQTLRHAETNVPDPVEVKPCVLAALLGEGEVPEPAVEVYTADVLDVLKVC